MGSDIPKIKIGTNLSDLANFVKNNSSLSQAQKNCIFNFIEDEKATGDGKVSNQVELSMLLSWLKPGNKDAAVIMPESLKAEADNVDVYKSSDGNSVTLIEKVDENTNLIDELDVYEYSDGHTTKDRFYASESFYIDGEYNAEYNVDKLVDEDNDGIADYRIKSTDNKGVLIKYSDHDLDGEFDQKVVSKDNTEGDVHYERKADGIWTLTDG